jgi:hypothetical protein
MHLSLCFALSDCTRPAAIRSFSLRGLTGGVTRRVPGLGVVIAPALGVQGLSLCSRFGMQGPRHLAPRVGSKFVSVDGFDPTSVIGVAKVGSPLTGASGWLLSCPKISLGSRSIRKDGAEKSAMARGIQEMPEKLERSQNLLSSVRCTRKYTAGAWLISEVEVLLPRD